MKIKLKIPNEFNSFQIGELYDRLCYLSEKVQYVSHIEEQGVFSLDVKDNTTGIEEMYYKVVDEVKGYKTLPSRVIKENIKNDINYPKVVIKEENLKGYYTPEKIKYRNFLDKFFIEFSNQYNALHRDYPIILEKENMERNKYHLEFPQNIMGVFENPHNYDYLKKIKEQNPGSNALECDKSKKQYLRPCICYSTYGEFADSINNNNIIITGMGKCFRNEVEWKISNYRRKEFYMREIVFIGDKEFVLNMRTKIIDYVWLLFTAFELSGKIETASDPFFFSEDFKKGIFQKIADAKYELVAPLKGGSVSLASFNFCGQTLCKAYNIRDYQHNFLYSGCVAFGLDRWVEFLIGSGITFTDLERIHKKSQGQSISI